MFSQLLVPIDFSEASLKTAHKAIEMAKTFDATPTFIHIIEPSETIPYPVHIELESYRELATESANKNMKEFIGQLKLEGMDFKQHIDHGVPHEKIDAYANDHKMDLIVISPHGKSGLEKFFVGSVTDRLIHSTQCPVLLIK